MTENGDWLRARGLGRERFAGYLAEYLGTLGYTIERTDSAEPLESRVRAELGRMTPSVPPSANSLSFRLYPTSGGAALVWETPRTLAPEDRARMDRFVLEITAHLERVIATESHAAAKIVKPPQPHLPWQEAVAIPLSSPATTGPV